MAKRKESGIEFVASLVWPAGIALGFLAFIGIQYGLNWIWGSSDNPFLSGLGKVAATGTLTPLCLANSYRLLRGVGGVRLQQTQAPAVAGRSNRHDSLRSILADV